VASKIAGEQSVGPSPKQVPNGLPGCGYLWLRNMASEFSFITNTRSRWLVVKKTLRSRFSRCSGRRYRNSTIADAPCARIFYERSLEFG
jgi:hypothetical protein